jgi:Tol biopolymer transport system component
MLRSNELRVTTVASALLVAALLAVLVVWGARAAEAAFPGANGAIAYTSGTSIFNLDIYRIDPDGFEPTNLTPNMTATNESMPAWSSEGTWIAFVSTDNTQGTAGSDREIWRMTARGGGQTQLTDNTEEDLEPSWFPTDTKIAFRRDVPATTTAHIWVLRLNESGNVVGEDQLTSGSSSNIQPAVSPNGARIAFASNRDGDFEIFVMKADGTGVKQITKNTNANLEAAKDWNPDWSPDGRRITFECKRRGSDDVLDEEICVMNSDGTKLKQLTNNTAADIDPVFSPDGKRISFERDPGASRDIWRMRADGANQFNVTDDGSTRIDANPSWQAR